MAKRSPKKSTNPKQVTALTHEDASRKNIPTAEFQSVMAKEQQAPVPVVYSREGVGEALAEEKAARNRDLDPQLVWRGKDEQDWSDLVVHAPPLFIQEKVHPKVLIDDLRRRTEADREAADNQFDLFHDFNGVPEGDAKTEFYQHDANWTNRMILGDSLQVMASLAEREGLRGQVQCIYFDPPYGIKFNSNFQWSTTSRDVKDGNKDHITREPEQVKAFRDTWRDGIQSYLTYLRDRLSVARDLLCDTGSIFVQIGDENVHRVRTVMDEVFGEGRLVSQIAFRTTTGRSGASLAAASNYILWYSKSDSFKYRDQFTDKMDASSTGDVYTRVRHTGTSHYRKANSDESSDVKVIPDGYHLFRPDNLTSSRPAGDGDVRSFVAQGYPFTPGKGTFKTNATGLCRLQRSNRLWPTSRGTLQYIRHFDDFPVMPIANMWTDTGTGSFTDDKIYVVQTATKVIERCLLMASDPGDLVFDPTRRALLDEFWKLRIARQKEIDASIAAKAEFEYLYDKPYEDKKKVRVAGPFTVESLSPHRTLGVDENDDLIDPQRCKDTAGSGSSDEADFVRVILENLKAAGVQQAHKEDRITFSSVAPWPGRFICAEGQYTDKDGASKRAGIFIGPEFGTVARQDLVAAAREAGDADFDVLIACAFNYEAIASEFNKLGRIPVLKARMNAELHMGDQLKSTGAGNLFVIFGEPDIDILPADNGQIQVKINGVDVFHPSSGEVRSDNADGIACWFIDTDYNEESFFVRHAYFLGQNDPYKALKTTLKAEINEEAWETLNSDISRPFKKPKSGRIAVKVINHLGDEVMKVFRVE